MVSAAPLLQRGNKGAALFLHDLDEQHLAALNDILDLVFATQCHPAGARIVDFLGARTLLATLAVATALAAATPRATVIVVVAVFATVFAIIVFVGIAGDVAFLDRRDVVLVGRVDLFEAIFGEFFGQRFGAFVLGVVFLARHLAALFLIVAKPRLFLGHFGFGGEQGVAIFLGNLVIVGVDFAEGEEAVAIAAEIDEGRLQRRFDARDLG